MAEPFKNLIDPGAIRTVATRIPGAWDREAFQVQATSGLDDLELKDRVLQVAACLREHLPSDIPTAVAQILEGFPEAITHTDALTGGFIFWPILTFIERYGLDHPDVSLPALRKLTCHFSAEFAIRPFFEADPDGVSERLSSWVDDPNPHIRRLVSEGTRPRLPWGIRLNDRIARPRLLFPHLERLKDDPSEYVRRSVANHLNDVAKDHPDLVIDTTSRWSQAPSKAMNKLVKHALRTQIKAGDPRAYAVIGLAPFEGSVTTSLGPAEIPLGGAITLTATVQSATRQRVRFDYAVHYLKKNGTHRAKVFHWTERTLKAGESVTLTKVHTEKPVSTRRVYGGEHFIDLRLNGGTGEKHRFSLAVG